jgi:aldose 1-epimerase
LEIKFSAISDKDTIWNPTSHTYFNLDGEESGNIYSTTLKINADKFTPCDDQIIPTGKIEYVFDTDYDFTTARNVGKAIAKHGGYDDNFILNGILAATAVGGKSGVALNVYTNLPAMQFYSGNFIKGKGKSREYFPHDGFCLEPQYVPNAINIAGVDKPILKAGKEKTYYIKYEFDF